MGMMTLISGHLDLSANNLQLLITKGTHKKKKIGTAENVQFFGVRIFGFVLYYIKSSIWIKLDSRWASSVYKLRYFGTLKQCKKSKEKSPKTDFSNTIPVVHVNVDDDEYSMQSPVGRCLIFNHQNFDENPKREGTNEDVTRLYPQLKQLGFDVRVFQDSTVGEVMDNFKKAAKEDHSEYSCFICCILTHGDNGFLCAKNGVYPIQSLYDIFNGDNCPSLRGKPKIFFIQACQGIKTDSGGEVIHKKESMDTVVKIPTYADFLIMLSSFPGFVSFKNKFTGSYFIQCLCDVLKEHSENKHLMDMLIIVTRRIAIYFESCNVKDDSKHMKKQVPFITSTLTRNVNFFPKILS